MRLQKLTFPNATGQTLAARLDLPLDEQPLAYALFAHCFTCNKNFKAVSNISRALTNEGFGVLRFDFTGLGESEGDFAETNFSSNVDDLVAAADFLAQHDAAPQLLIGHSLGGAAVLQAAARIPSSAGVVTINAPADPRHLAQLLGDAATTIAAEGAATVTLAGQTFTIKQQFLADLEQSRMQETIRNLRKPLLIFHSPIDEIVGIENATQIFQAARHPKSFVSLDTADHLVSTQDESRFVGSMIAAWARKYIEQPQDAVRLHDPADNRVVAYTGSSGYTTEILANGHSLIADKPLSVGGANLGPSPYEFLLASLGACTSMTLRMYADRKSWPLEEIIVRLKHQKIHAADCAECETRSGKIDQIEREIELIGGLDDQQRARLLEIADRCPVHRTLHGEIVVKTTLCKP
jgi:putative redox protein